MTDTDDDLLTEVEAILKGKFTKEEVKSRVQSTALDPARAPRINQLVLPDDQRGRMPLTKDQYIIRENPQEVAWEREVRKFLRNLSPDHGHRVSAVMIYEWATGIPIKDLIEAGGAPSPDLKKINKVLRFYFGKPYSTYIANRKVPNCYRVKPGYYIRRHRPMTLELWTEYTEGTLYP